MLPEPELLFDVSRGASPRGDLGELRSVGPNFERFTAQLTARLLDAFSVRLSMDATLPEDIDAIIEEMWNDGWTPNAHSVELFARDFGLLTCMLLHDNLSGELVSRGSDAILHLSVWWPTAGLEAFPSHVAAKALLDRASGASLTSFVRGITTLLLGDEPRSSSPAS